MHLYRHTNKQRQKYIKSVLFQGSMELISQAAEAKIYSDGKKVIKIRTKKGYRITKIDQRLIQQRTKREATILQKVKVGVPKLLEVKKDTIVMEFIPGDTLKNILDGKLELARLAGERVAQLHALNIIHGDLTSSNMRVHKNVVYLIDFGLSFFSDKTEDKAVDLHLFKQALQSRHYRVYNTAYHNFIEGYKKNPDWKNILFKLEEVEKRGRYKNKQY
jgi:Kae1-associated kinase Bud32